MFGFPLMLPIGHVPTQIYANKTCILHYNLAIIFIYFVEYIFFYIFFMHYRQFGKLPGFYFQNNLVVKRKYGAVFQKSRSKVKIHLSHKTSLHTKFQLESLFH
jgi:hypothetical protein